MPRTAFDLLQHKEVMGEMGCIKVSMPRTAFDLLQREGTVYDSLALKEVSMPRTAFDLLQRAADYENQKGFILFQCRVRHLICCNFNNSR